MMKKLKYVLERGYPYIIAISASIILQRVKGVLDNVKTGNVEHGNYITVTIGGDLP